MKESHAKRRGKNQEVIVIDVLKYQVHIILQDTYSRGFCPAVPASYAGFYVHVAGNHVFHAVKFVFKSGFEFLRVLFEFIVLFVGV